MSQIRTIKFADPEASARGRNGYFRPVEADIWKHDGRVRIELFSKTRSSSPPALLELASTDLARLIAAAQAVANEA